MKARPGIRVKIARILAHWVKCRKTLGDATMEKYHLNRGLCYVVRYLSGLPAYDIELMVRELRVMFREDGLDEDYPFGEMTWFLPPPEQKVRRMDNLRTEWCEKIIARYPCTARINPVY